MSGLDTVAVGFNDLQDEGVFVVHFGVIWGEEETCSVIANVDYMATLPFCLTFEIKRKSHSLSLLFINMPETCSM